MLLYSKSIRKSAIVILAALFILYNLLYPDDGVKETNMLCTSAHLRELIDVGAISSGTSNNHDNIAIITYFSEDSSKLGKATAWINKYYAVQHGYTFIHYTEAPTVYRERRPAWYKMHFVLKTLETGNFSYVMWIDSDAIFCNPHVSLSDYIKMMGNRDWLLAQDPGYSFREVMSAEVRALNSGAFIVRNTDWIRDTIHFILTDSIFQDNYNYDPTWSDERKASIASVNYH